MESPPVHVMIALLGGAAGVAGLTLVFLGIVISAVQLFAATTPRKILDRYRRIAWAASWSTPPPVVVGR
jgi:hypothetical protein